MSGSSLSFAEHSEKAAPCSALLTCLLLPRMEDVQARALAKLWGKSFRGHGLKSQDLAACDSGPLTTV